MSNAAAAESHTTTEIRPHARWGRRGLGGDATFYHVPDNMIDYYGTSHSFHVFVRYRPQRGDSMAHRH